MQLKVIVGRTRIRGPTWSFRGSPSGRATTRAVKHLAQIGIEAQVVLMSAADNVAVPNSR